MSYREAVQSIRKLLELSKQSPYDGESKNSVDKAKYLAEKYGIDIHTLMAKRETKVIRLHDKNFFHLISALSDYFDCDAVLEIGENMSVEITGLPDDLENTLKYCDNLKIVVQQSIALTEYDMSSKGKSMKGLKDLYYSSYLKGLKSVFPKKVKPITEKGCSIVRNMPALDFESTDEISKVGFMDGQRFANRVKNEVEGAENR